MSETEDRLFRVTWRSITTSANGPGAMEYLSEREVTAAYYRRDDDRFVFKRADGRQAFDVMAALVETIECLDDQSAGGAPQHITVNVSGTAVAEAEIAGAVRTGVRQYQQRNGQTGL